MATSKQQQTKSYADLKQELDELLLAMQSEELDIDKALAMHARGSELVAELERYLKNAQNRIEKIKVQLDKPVV